MSLKSFYLIIFLLLYIVNNTFEKFDSDDNEKVEEENEDYSAFFGAKIEKKNEQVAEKKGPKVWDRWGRWSECSVTCGIGKMTRWRHCVAGGCEKGEKEAQIKTCTLSAC